MLVALQNITFEFGARAIVQDTTWHIMPGERIGLIGLNGTGKSTLLRIIMGEYSVSSGTVERAKNLSIGFFNQDLLSFESQESILHVAMTAFERALQVEKDLERFTRELEHRQDDQLLHAYSDALHEFEALDGYNLVHKAEAMLEGLGFSTQDLQRPYQEFSGGWRMRVLLARMMLQQPDLLMLDEPTNHLDLPSIEWLERYLQHYDGTVIIVSHDRYFLNRMVNRIVELYQQQLHLYSGNYDYYLQEKELRSELQRRAYENQQDYIRQQERFIERFRAKATKAAQAQSAMKRLEKLERIESVDEGPARIRIAFNVERQPGKILCTLKHISKAYGSIQVLQDASVEINRGDKIALIGANGKGKSTLLRIINGSEQGEGERQEGHNVQTSFYAQHQLESLRLDHEILDELKTCGSGLSEQELRGLLGCFLFTGDDVFKKIKILSGGEKARVALAKTIISQANFLLLDEPTNHLDMNSVEMLIEALNLYQGSYVLVSHDRYFVSRTANKIWEIQDGAIKEFSGTYAEYETWKSRTPVEASTAAAPAAPGVQTPAAQAPDPEIAAPRTAIDKELKKEYQRQQKRFQQAEEQLKRLQEQKLKLEANLADPQTYAQKDKFQEVELAYQKVSQDLSFANQQYEQLFETMMDLESRVAGA